MSLVKVILRVLILNKGLRFGKLWLHRDCN